ncbi:alkaline phosphatase family protein [Sphingomonas jatrophae]|uniref:Alkaline phosphatase n=1 Tax=Sphingomonas jatrophae TaxID=1166337 RepID=A0A1I6LH72_9SPHN|nr:alkaline phosphatase family protein [Sphingomonas jatrophae]SFS02648.1 Type I phosphodiesterase / nucleotide pyrophosphatase [Sphingomonas jatrophae]
MRAHWILAALTALLPTAASAAPPPRPKLVVMISVDQFSADLFAEYRGTYTSGLKRLMQGGVFPAGYQSHAATETCPGHSTLLTGSRPARTGIIANDWLDLGVTRGKDSSHGVYCAEDETKTPAPGQPYVVSPAHLRVPTLGDRLKAVSPQSRVVSVAGKDRAAVMMGGHTTDQIWFWDPSSKPGFVTLVDRTGPAPAAVAAANARVAATVARPPAVPLPPICRGRDVAVPIGAGKSVGRLVAMKPNDARGFRASPLFDAAVADLAIALADEMKLGRGPATDVLIVGLSASDYVGHTYGTEGAEMCAQQVGLDATIGRLLAALDRIGIPYEVALSADHGGFDLPERLTVQGTADAARVSSADPVGTVGKAIGRTLGLSGPVLLGTGPFGDVYVARDVPADRKAQVVALAKARLLAEPQVAAVFTAEELLTVPSPTAAVPMDEWPLAQRFRASFDAARSGDLVVALKPHVVPIADPTKGYVATHGSPWNYDRRVPILFWYPGMTGFEHPLPVETVDILPTLAATIGLDVPAAEIDGRCLDLDAGAGSTCGR